MFEGSARALDKSIEVDPDINRQYNSSINSIVESIPVALLRDSLEFC